MTPTNTGGLVVVIPAKNEAAVIAKTLAAIQVAVLRLKLPCRTVVVDDGSTDNTAVVAEACGATVIRLPVSRGPLSAWLAGVAATSAEVAFFVDADVILHEDALVLLLASLDDTNVGVASGRVVPMASRISLVGRSARFSAMVLHRVRSEVGNSDYIAIGRLMAVRAPVLNNCDPNDWPCDRVVAREALARGYDTTYVPSARVFYSPVETWDELRLDFLRTRRDVARHQGFDSVAKKLQVRGVVQAFFEAPILGLVWVAFQVRLRLVALRSPPSVGASWPKLSESSDRQ